MIWLMEILSIYLEEQLLKKILHTKPLILLKIQNMMDIKDVLLEWFDGILIKSVLALIHQVVLLKLKLSLTKT